MTVEWQLRRSLNYLSIADTHTAAILTPILLEPQVRSGIWRSPRGGGLLTRPLALRGALWGASPNMGRLESNYNHYWHQYYHWLWHPYSEVALSSYLQIWFSRSTTNFSDVKCTGAAPLVGVETAVDKSLNRGISTCLTHVCAPSCL